MDKKFKYFVSIRFKSTNKSYNFGTNDDSLAYEDFVVVDTIRVF